MVVLRIRQDLELILNNLADVAKCKIYKYAHKNRLKGLILGMNTKNYGEYLVIEEYLNQNLPELNIQLILSDDILLDRIFMLFMR